MENTNRTVEEVKTAIKAYFEENEDDFNDVIEELDNYNGYLGDDRYYSMDDLDELFCDTTATEILNRAFFGHDEECYTTDAHGDKHYSEFNPNRNYFRSNGYGNLVSADFKDYSDRLDEYFINDLIENRYNLYLDNLDELNELLDELEEAEATTAA